MPVDLLRIPDIMSYEPGNHDRRLVSADGHLLSVDRRTARLDVQAWFNRVDDPDADLRPYRRGDTWTRYGYSFRDDLNTTPGPCSCWPARAR